MRLENFRALFLKKLWFALSPFGVFLVFASCSVKPGTSSSSSGNGSAAAISNCGAESPDVTQKRQQNFDTTLHALLLQQTCVSCHDGKSGRAPYPHSATDVGIAYSAAVSLVDLTNPAVSTIVKKVQSDHNCGSDAQCQALANQMIAAIQTWSTKEAALPPPPQCVGDLTTGLNITLPGKLISPTMLSSTTATTLRWDMGAINPTVGKMLFSIDVLNATAPSLNNNGNYKIQNAIVASQDLRVKVMSVVPVINGKLSPDYANYSGINFIVDHQPFDPTASILGQAPISDYPQQINWVNPATGDTLGFVITIQQTTDNPSNTTKAPGCKAYDKFQLVYNNVFDLKIPMNGSYVGQCTRCHGDPKNAANAVMNLSGNGVDPCLQVLTRVNLTNPLQSLLLLKPSQADATAAQNTGDMHPVKIDLLNDPTLNSEKALILQWIQAEANAAGGS